jgi:hypothetical protein
MVNKSSFILFILLLGCGTEVKIDNSKLESYSNVTTTTSTALVAKVGSLKRGNGSTKDMIIYNGTNYNVSMYSSYSALEYISAKPLNYQGSVTFKGTMTGNDLLLETLTN